MKTQPANEDRAPFRRMFDLLGGMSKREVEVWHGIQHRKALGLPIGASREGMSSLLGGMSQAELAVLKGIRWKKPPQPGDRGA